MNNVFFFFLSCICKLTQRPTIIQTFEYEYHLQYYIKEQERSPKHKINNKQRRRARGGKEELGLEGEEGNEKWECEYKEGGETEGLEV